LKSILTLSRPPADMFRHWKATFRWRAYLCYMEDLLHQIRHCTHCRDHLPFAPRPIVQAGSTARLLIIGQAPGLKVQQSGIPWNDQSGKTLRRWLGLTEAQFYNPELVGLMPMGFCFPGTGSSGDLPPRPECATLWHKALLAQMPALTLTLLIGQYAQAYYLPSNSFKSLTETVQHVEHFLPDYFPLVHPSPRNRNWHLKNPWFETDVVPKLQAMVQGALV
jgi:uracil-DNA glycosylase